ncbi:General amino-acid permease GAP2 [Fusarium oxysporum f. sp. albedinis]|nr:General amino-acid permease GAP2 [Fusarium oxysporum f. sp. albedinis]
MISNFSVKSFILGKSEGQDDVGDESDYDDSGGTEDDEEKIYAWPEQESSCSDEESATENQSFALLTPPSSSLGAPARIEPQQ